MLNDIAILLFDNLISKKNPIINKIIIYHPLLRLATIMRILKTLLLSLLCLNLFSCKDDSDGASPEVKMYPSEIVNQQDNLTETFEYNSENQLIKHNIIEGTTILVFTEYDYDNSGKMVATTTYVISQDGSQYFPIETMRIEYNTDGDVAKVRWFEPVVESPDTGGGAQAASISRLKYTPLNRTFGRAFTQRLIESLPKQKPDLNNVHHFRTANEVQFAEYLYVDVEYNDEGVWSTFIFKSPVDGSEQGAIQFTYDDKGNTTRLYQTILNVPFFEITSTFDTQRSHPLKDVQAMFVESIRPYVNVILEETIINHLSSESVTTVFTYEFNDKGFPTVMSFSDKNTQSIVDGQLTYKYK